MCHVRVGVVFLKYVVRRTHTQNILRLRQLQLCSLSRCLRAWGLTVRSLGRNAGFVCLFFVGPFLHWQSPTGFGRLGFGFGFHGFRGNLGCRGYGKECEARTLFLQGDLVGIRVPLPPSGSRNQS